MKLLTDKRFLKVSVGQKIRGIKQKGYSFWHSLDFAQRCYFTALMIMIALVASSTPLGFDSEEGEAVSVIVLVIACIGLIREFWPWLVKFAHSIPGKAFIVLFYAFIGNFALVDAAGTVNDLTGVDAESLPYTHNLSALLSVPIWFVLTSVCALLLINLLMPLYLVVLMILRPLGGHKIWLSPNYRFPFITALLRYFFTLVISFTFVTYSSSIGLSSQPLNQIIKVIIAAADKEIKRSKISEKEQVVQLPEANAPEVMEEGNRLVQQPSGESTTEVLAEKNNPVEQSDDDPFTITVNVDRGESEGNTIDPEFEQELQKLNEVSAEQERNFRHYKKIINHLLSVFIYEQEADEKSRCEFEQGSRVIEINDYEILQITEDEAEPYGYKYEVKKCISAAFPITAKIN